MDRQVIHTFTVRKYRNLILRFFRWKGYWAVAHRAKHFGLPGLPGASLPLGRESGFRYSGCSQRAGPAFQPGLLTKSRLPLRHGYGVRRQGPPRSRFPRQQWFAEVADVPS
jgi:hypothetical protein